MTVTNATDELDPPPLERLIGFDTLSRPLESWYAFVSRLIRANLLNDVDIRKQLPADWVRCAFAPHEVQTSDLAVPAPYIDRLPDVALKLRPITWQPFPELSSAPPECLRGCPRCLEAGYHSYAMQGDAIARCSCIGARIAIRNYCGRLALQASAPSSVQRAARCWKASTVAYMYLTKTGLPQH